METLLFIIFGLLMWGFFGSSSNRYTTTNNYEGGYGNDEDYCDNESSFDTWNDECDD